MTRPDRPTAGEPKPSAGPLTCDFTATNGESATFDAILGTAAGKGGCPGDSR